MLFYVCCSIEHIYICCSSFGAVLSLSLSVDCVCVCVRMCMCVFMYLSVDVHDCAYIKRSQRLMLCVFLHNSIPYFF